jgi:hypothetical protein
MPQKTDVANTEHISLAAVDNLRITKIKYEKH